MSSAMNRINIKAAKMMLQIQLLPAVALFYSTDLNHWLY